MKKLCKLLRIIAFMAVIGFSVLSCGENGDSSSPSGSGDTTVTLNSVTANGSATQTTTQLTLTFSQAITELSADDIFFSGLSGVNKGSLGGFGPVYTLDISGFSSGGNLNVAVVKTGYIINESPKTVTVYVDNGSGISVTLNSVTANGSSLQTTTQLTLTFGQEITGLSANDITLSGVSGVTKGTLSNTSAIYTLPISGFSSGGSLSVAVAKANYTISGSPKTVSIFYEGGVIEPPIPITLDVTANGSPLETTTQLILTFSQVIPGLSANDISLNGLFGITKGTLTGSGPVYTLPISGFSSGGLITVIITLPDLVLPPMNVTIYYNGDSIGTIPNPPTGVKAIQSPNINDVSWDAVPGANSYNVYYWIENSPDKIFIANVTESTYMHIIWSWVPEVTYYYYITAVNSAGESDFSIAAKAVDPGIELGIPANVTATAQSSSSINISWGSVSGATGYYIYRSSTSTGTYTQVGSSTTTSYTDTELSASTTYHYRVAAYNSNGTSSQSSSVSATTQSSGGGGTVPGTPTGVTASRNPTGSTTVRVSWNSVSGATSYRVYYSSTGSGSGSLEGSPTTTSYDSTNHSTTSTHYFRVSAVNSTGEGSPSSWVSVEAVAPTFVAVTSITGVPTSGTAGTALTLTGTVNPSNATNKTIIWSVNTAGTTGATISGSTLNTTAAGTVSVRATIMLGGAGMANYTQTFNITIAEPPFTLQVARDIFLQRAGSQWASTFPQTSFTWNSTTRTLTFKPASAKAFTETTGSPARTFSGFYEMEVIFNTNRQITSVRTRLIIIGALNFPGLSPANPTVSNPHRYPWDTWSTATDIDTGITRVRMYENTSVSSTFVFGFGTFRRTS